jgi:hypothetical protein
VAHSLVFAINLRADQDNRIRMLSCATPATSSRMKEAPPSDYLYELCFDPVKQPQVASQSGRRASHHSLSLRFGLAPI